MSHYHQYQPTIVANLLQCRCGSTSPASQPTETSVEAAVAIAPDVKGLRGRVYEFIKTRGRATDEEICAALSLNPSTGRPRRIELVEEGLVKDSGLRALTKSKRRAVLWEIAS